MMRSYYKVYRLKYLMQKLENMIDEVMLLKII